MAGDNLYGYTNKILAEINACLLNYEDLSKFIYYTDAKYGQDSILEEEPIPTSKIYNKHFFVYKRVPEVIEKAGVYIYIDIYRQIPTVLGGKIKDITFTINILVHNSCMSTIHGNRAICICSAIENALTEYVEHSIGKISLVRMSPLLGLVKDYGGYQLQFVASGFKDDMR